MISHHQNKLRALVCLSLTTALAACNWGTELTIPPPELEPDTRSVFVAFVEPGDIANVHAYDADTDVFNLLLPISMSEPADLYVFQDARDLATLEIVEGRVLYSQDDDAIALPLPALTWSFGDELGWQPVNADLPAALLDFRFGNFEVPSRCAVLEYLHTVDVSRFIVAESSPPIIVPWDDDQAVVIPRPAAGVPPEMIVVTATSSTVVNVGLSVVSANQRTALRLRDGRLAVAGDKGEVWIGVPGQPFVLTATIPPDRDGYRAFLALAETSTTQTSTGRLFGLTKYALWDLTEAPQITMDTPVSETDRLAASKGGLSPIGEGWLMYIFEDDETVFRWNPERPDDPGNPDDVYTDSEARILDQAEGLGPVLMTYREAQLWNGSEFRFLGALDRSTQDVAAWRGRLFFLSDASWQQIVVGDEGQGQCPLPSPNDVENPSLEVFGDYLARTGQSRETIDVYRLHEP